MSRFAARVHFSQDLSCFAVLRCARHYAAKLGGQSLCYFKCIAKSGICIPLCGHMMAVDSSLDESVLELNGIFASKLGLRFDERVSVELMDEPPTCERILVKPESDADWEIVELHRDFVEANLLNQLRVVSRDLLFPVWVADSVCLFLVVDQIEPTDLQFATLVEGSEVAVVPPISNEFAKKNCLPSTKAKFLPTVPNGELSHASTSHLPNNSTAGETSLENSFDTFIFDEYPQNSATKVGANFWSDAISWLPSILLPDVNSPFQISAQANNEHALTDADEPAKDLAASEILTDYSDMLDVDFELSLRVQPLPPELRAFIEEQQIERTESSQFPSFSGTVERPISGIQESNRMERNNRNMCCCVDGAGTTRRSRRQKHISACFCCSLLHQPCVGFMRTVDFRNAIDAQKGNYGVHLLKRPVNLSSFIAKLRVKSEDNPSADTPSKNKSKEKALNSGASTENSDANVSPSVVSSAHYARIVLIGGTSVEIEQQVDGQLRCAKCQKTLKLLRKYLLPSHVIFADTLRRQMNASALSWIGLHLANKKELVVPQSVTLYPLTLTSTERSSELIDRFLKTVRYLNCASGKLPLVVSSGAIFSLHDFVAREDADGSFECLLTLSSNLSVAGSLMTRPDHFSVLSPAVLQSAKISVKNLIEPQTNHARNASKLDSAKDNRLSNLTSLNELRTMLPVASVDQLDWKPFGARRCCLTISEELFEQAVAYARFALATSPLTECVGRVSGYLLLTGAFGCGKSSVCSSLCRELAEWPNHVFSLKQECKTLRGKKVESLAKIFAELFGEAIERQPSLIFFDDLDEVCRNASAMEQLVPGNELSFSRVANVFTRWLDILNDEDHRVMILATAKSERNLHASLTRAKGKQYFRRTLNIGLPDLAQRKAMLTALIRGHESLSKAGFTEPSTSQSIDSEALAKLTESYSLLDLRILCDRAVAAALMRNGPISSDDFRGVLVDFKPLNLRNVQLKAADELADCSLAAVGGLYDAKRILSQMLLWPSQYPHLYANLPIRLPRGALLYGFPGTGKTLLAAAMAKECRMNFISVKGPELLSKYIGASEESVRNTFERAKSASPCLLFFDEFDALAPRRGHDSTGVTDRVVNQLLVELDGVEELEGVYVIAASNRPDLIDPALLRPGRLDKMIFCDIPSQAERFEILTCLAQTMSLDDDVELSDLAEATDRFTGADLRAVLTNAQILAVREKFPHHSQGYSSSDRPRSPDSSVKREVGLWSQVVYFPSLNDTPCSQFAEDELQALEQKFDIRLTTTSNRRLTEANAGMVSSDLKTASGKISAEVTPVRQAHILSGLRETKPSLDERELRRLKLVYDEFRSRGKPGKAVAEVKSLLKAGQRATLA